MSMGTEQTRTAAIYVRISADPEGERAGVERQRKECQELADRLGLTVVDTYEDNDVSAYSGKRRPRFEDLLADAEAGRFAVVIAWASDRLYRRMTDLVRITETLARRASIVTVTGGDVDLNGAEGIMRAQVLGSVAEFESRRKAERVAARARQRAEGGVMVASNRPKGWRWADPCPADATCLHKARKQPDGTEALHAPAEAPRMGSRAGLVLDPDEAPLIADAYRIVAEGGTLHAAWRHITAGGIGLKDSSALRGILLNGRNAGLVEHRGVVVAEAKGGASLIDRPTFDTVCAILRDPSRRTSPGRPANTPLGGGLLRCGKCGGRMAAGRRSASGGQYVCTTCRNLRTAREPINALVLDLVAEVLAELDARHPLAVAGSSADTSEARAEVAALEGRLEALASLMASGELDPIDYATASRKVRTALEAATKRLVTASSGRALADAMSAPEGIAAVFARLRDADDAEPLRRLLGDVLESVTVMPDQSVSLAWKVPGPLPTVLRSKADRAERDADIIRRYTEGETAKAIAASLGMSRNTVADIVRRAGATRK